MHYSKEDIAYAESIIREAPSLHLLQLAEMVKRGASYKELFHYGQRFLPNTRNPQTGKVDLELLDTYVPEVVSYFDALGELPSLPKELQDLAIDLAIYANGESVQIDAYYNNLIPAVEIEKALRKFSGLE